VGYSKLDPQGYLIQDTYVAGYPFPKPSGQFKAQEVMFNWEKNYINGENAHGILEMKGITKNLNIDFDACIDMYWLRLYGRILMEPYGW